MFPDKLSPTEEEMFHCNKLLVVGQATEVHCTSTIAKDLLSATCKTHIEATCGQKLNFSFHAISSCNGCLKDNHYTKCSIFSLWFNTLSSVHKCEIPRKQPLCLIPTHAINNVSVLTLGDSMNMPLNRELSSQTKSKVKEQRKQNCNVL